MLTHRSLYTACGFAFLTLLTSLCIARRRAASFLTLGIGLFAALLTTVVFLIDVIFVAVAKSRVKSETDGLVTGDYGNAVRLLPCRRLYHSRPTDILMQCWMVLGATIALYGALVAACLTIFRGKRKQRFVLAVVSACSASNFAFRQRYHDLLGSAHDILRIHEYPRQASHALDTDRRLAIQMPRIDISLLCSVFFPSVQHSTRTSVICLAHLDAAGCSYESCSARASACSWV